MVPAVNPVIFALTGTDVVPPAVTDGVAVTLVDVARVDDVP
jgi:uncharacterized membrane protein YbjE (DUF340 family)